LWGYREFIQKINETYDIDLSLYKEAQMKRRITSLRNKNGYDNFYLYYKALVKDQQLLKEFFDRITINVSEFYRNPLRWKVLHEKIFPLLLKEKRTLSIWSAACSTGEEAYSLAIMLREHFPETKATILATDIDATILERAKKGVYDSKSLKDLPVHKKSKYFVYQNEQYHIIEDVKKHITFQKHDLLKDAYPSNMDLIVCRNVLIYFTEEAKNTVYDRLSGALNEQGVLFIGSTEQIFNPMQYQLSSLDTFFYQRNSIASVTSN